MRFTGTSSGLSDGLEALEQVMETCSDMPRLQGLALEGSRATEH